MATDKISWTAQQKLAITSAGKDVLVTASAGTGKAGNVVITVGHNNKT